MNIKTLKSKFEQAMRLLLVNSITRYNGSILLVEFPKSGGTWLGQLVSNYLGIPFPRNKMPLIRKSLFHSHYLPKWRIPKNKKIIFLVRDGRDVTVSLYYHYLIWNDKNKINPKDVLYHRNNTRFKNFEDVKGNMNEFIKYAFENKPSKLTQFTFMGNWYDYNKRWLEIYNDKRRNNVYLISYEELLTDPHTALSRMFSDFFHLEVDKARLNDVIQQFSFENQTNRKKGEESKTSFLRKGISGDWINYFGEKEKEIFKKYTKDLLVELGYEKNKNW